VGGTPAFKRPARRVRLGLPWNFPFYGPLNGPHPLVASFVRDNPDVDTVTLMPGTAIRSVHVDGVLPSLCERTRRVGEAHAEGYLQWTGFLEQVTIEAQSDRHDALFHHTTPLHIGSSPWIFHFESFPSLFMPFIFSGATAGLSLKKQDYFEAVRRLFASERCRMIFTHMQSSRDIFERVFDDPVLTAKLSCIGLGIETPERAAALEKFDRPGPIRILFTNSLHQNPDSFFLRGGHHLLRAFSQLREENAGIELTVISSIPDDLAAYFSGRDLEGVTWIQERVDDARLERLLLDHHVFALPAAGLHSYSLLRALSRGCVPIVSDALGYEEYTDGIQDSVLLVRGVREMIYRAEPEGWISDDYRAFVKPSRRLAGQIHRLLAEHSNPDLLRPMAQRNFDFCASRYDLPSAQQQFCREVESRLQVPCGRE